MADLIVRGGTVVDGTGAPGYTGDVEITDGTITAVSAPGAGPLPASVEKTGDDYSISLAAGTFKGKLSADGKTLTGALGQGAQSLPLTLTRK